MRKLNLGLIKIAWYDTGGIVMAVRTGLKPTSFNVYLLRDRRKAV